MVEVLITKEQMIAEMRNQIRLHNLEGIVTYALMGYKGAWGKFHGRKKGYLLISLSVPLNMYNKYERMVDTIKHEIAHALDYIERGKTNHDNNWKKWARKVGADPSSTHRAHFTVEQNREIYAYEGVCANCEIHSFVHRKPKYRTKCKKCTNEVIFVTTKKQILITYEANSVSQRMGTGTRAEQIRTLLAQGLSVSETAKATGAHYSQVHGIEKKMKEFCR